MVWTDPKTWLSGEVLSSNDMNLYVGDNSAFLKAGLDEIVAANSYRLALHRVFTSSATVDLDDALGDGTDTSWIRAVGYEMVAGGGGGGAGGATNAVGGGGGGGEYERGFVWSASQLRDGTDSDLTIVVGAGGTGGDAGATGAGTDGGESRITFAGGLSRNVTGGVKGTRSTISQQSDNRGDYGGPGGGTSQTIYNTAIGYWSVSSGGQDGGNALSIVHADSSLGSGGNGGASALGGGGRGGITRGFIPAGIPTNSKGYGGGGGGAAATGIDGGDGGPGVVILTFYR